jgi:hypothetical protein
VPPPESAWPALIIRSPSVRVLSLWTPGWCVKTWGNSASQVAGKPYRPWSELTGGPRPSPTPSPATDPPVVSRSGRTPGGRHGRRPRNSGGARAATGRQRQLATTTSRSCRRAHRAMSFDAERSVCDLNVWPSPTGQSTGNNSSVAGTSGGPRSASSVSGSGIFRYRRLASCALAVSPRLPLFTAPPSVFGDDLDCFVGLPSRFW